jgi:hypothetical protein
MATPPMWAKGQAIGYTSPAPRPTPPTMPFADAITDPSV